MAWVDAQLRRSEQAVSDDQHERLYQQAWSAAQALRADTSVDMLDTKASLENLAADISLLADSLGC